MGTAVLILGFKDLFNHRETASLEEALLARVEQGGISSLVVRGDLPAEAQASATALALIREYTPDHVLLVSTAKGASAVGLQRLAIRPQTYPQTADDGLFTTIPLRQAHAALGQAEIPASISDDIVDGPDNDVVYSILDFAAKHKSTFTCGWLRVPLSVQQAFEFHSSSTYVDKEVERRAFPSMAISTIADAIFAVVSHS
jgi:pyrrolidone-carboxylate peptidase